MFLFLDWRISEIIQYLFFFCLAYFTWHNALTIHFCLVITEETETLRGLVTYRKHTVSGQFLNQGRLPSEASVSATILAPTSPRSQQQDDMMKSKLNVTMEVLGWTPDSFCLNLTQFCHFLAGWLVESYNTSLLLPHQGRNNVLTVEFIAWGFEN